MQRSAKALTRQVLLQSRISIPNSVKVESTGEQLLISGALGTIRTDLSKLDTKGCTALKILPGDRAIALACCDKAFFGTIQTLLKNSIQGVTQGYLRYLRIQGIGYRAALQEQTLTFKLGYSHDITYTLPASLRAFLPEPTLVGIYGIDKTQVTQAAANIRALRPPSVYKGKGIRYADEVLKLKAGKKK